MYVFLAPTWQRPRTLHGRCRMFRRIRAHPQLHTVQESTHSNVIHRQSTVQQHTHGASGFTAASGRLAARSRFTAVQPNERRTSVYYTVAELTRSSRRQHNCSEAFPSGSTETAHAGNFRSNHFRGPRRSSHVSVANAGPQPPVRGTAL